MATKVLQVDLEALPSQISGLDGYRQALVFFRLRRQIVAQAWLPVSDNGITRTELEQAVRRTGDWTLWQAVLYDFLDWNDRPPPVSGCAPATIAVCTRDRPEDLQRSLQALLALPDDGQEYLVVDNAPSSEASREVVAGFGERVHYVREERPGLDAARNRALREAQHEIILFNDDDAMPDPGWLRAILPHFQDPSVLCVTGLTLPWELETEAQEWFEKIAPFQRGFARVVYDMDRLHPLAAGRVGAGANMALRRSVLELVGPFDEALDAGTATLSGGDTEMFGRILAVGYRIVYEPAAISWHRHRRTWEELRRALYGYGAGVYAIWTRRLLLEHESSVPLLALGWLWYEQLPRLLRSLLRRGDYIPLELLLAELRGCLAGPLAYRRSLRQLRRGYEGWLQSASSYRRITGKSS